MLLIGKAFAVFFLKVGSMPLFAWWILAQMVGSESDQDRAVRRMERLEALEAKVRAL